MSPRIINLQAITTVDKKNNNPNGVFVPIWRDWDQLYIANPQMVYMATLPVGEMKGPHLNKIRTGYVTVLTGELILVFKEDGIYTEIEMNANSPKTVEILPGTGFLMINVGKTIGMIVNLCYPAWHPDNQDNYPADFSEYDFTKWDFIKI
jgi:hypothetical protein